MTPHPKKTQKKKFEEVQESDDDDLEVPIEELRKLLNKDYDEDDDPEEEEDDSSDPEPDEAIELGEYEEEYKRLKRNWNNVITNDF